jgi:subtilisin family serine protease
MGAAVGMGHARVAGRGRRLARLLTLLTVAWLLVAATPAATPATVGQPAGGAPVAVIVRALPGTGQAAERLVERLGGLVERQLPIIGGFSAMVPAGAVPELTAAPEISDVSGNSPVRLNGIWSGISDWANMKNVADTTQADRFWAAGRTGRGIGVALIDSGITPVPGLNASGKVVHGPDLSFESQSPDLRNLDTFGHGTHMAGIIAGRDAGATTIDLASADSNFMGMAPEAKLISVKVADQAGATDISQILAAIDWVVQHRNDPGLNIKVLNLSFGTDGEQGYALDPLAYATEVAWRAGITVVVSAGNAGFGSSKLNNPAYDPFVIAVGASDVKGTRNNDDDVPATFSSAGDSSRKPDFLAPGKSIVSLGVPGSAVDQAFPSARRGTRFMIGSGTSQAAAVVSGAAALLYSKYPGATPDQIKKLLKDGADHDDLVAGTPVNGQGILDLYDVDHLSLPSTSASVQPFTKSTGTGKLDLARGSAKLVDKGVTLSGEKDVFGRSFSASTWAAKSASGTAWSGGQWLGSRWTGDGWSGSRWTAGTWSGSAWSGTTWSSVTYSGSRWTGSRWTDVTWSGSRWLGTRWASNAWSGAGWN